VIGGKPQYHYTVSTRAKAVVSAWEKGEQTRRITSVTEERQTVRLHSQREISSGGCNHLEERRNIPEARVEQLRSGEELTEPKRELGKLRALRGGAGGDKKRAFTEG